MRKGWLRRRDGALSDIVGTALLLGVTVVLVAAATVTFSTGSTRRAATPTTDLRANATTGSPGILTLVHTGGAAFDASDLEVIVNGDTWSERIPVTSAAEWALGTSLTLPLNRTLSGGERLDVLIVSKSLGGAVSSAAVDVVSSSLATLAGGSFSIFVQEPASAAAVTVPAGATLRVVADVAHPDGRKALLGAYVDMSPLGGSPVAELYDDGSHGDAIGGDLEYTAYLVVPPEATPSATPVAISAFASDVDGATVFAPAAFRVVVTEGAATLVTNLTNVTNVILSNLTNLSSLTTVLNNPTTQSFFQSLLSSTNISEFLNTSAASGLDNATIALLQNFTSLTASNSTNLSQTLVTYSNITPLDVPVITGFTPANGSSSVQVTLTGAKFTYANSVSFVNGSDAYGLAWSIVNDSTIRLQPPAAAPPGNYTIRVVNPAGSAQSATPFALEAPTPNTPTGLAMSPTSGVAGDTIGVTGLYLDSVRQVTLVNGTTAYDATWWIDAGRLQFVIPPNAAPPSTTAVNYIVRLTGTAGAPADVPTPLKVNAQPAPKIFSFTPKLGVPFTQVNVIGDNFVNVQSVTFNGTNVYYAVVSPSQLLLVTHGSLTPGWYSINVTTATGSNATTLGGAGLFQALKAPIVPVYSPSVFQYVATWATKNVSASGPGDTFDLWTKFKLVSNVSIGGVSGLKLVNASNCNANVGGACNFFTYVPFKPGNQVPQGFGTAVCGSGAGPWVFRWTGSMQNYVSSTFTSQFYLTYSFSPTGNTNNLQTASVVTTDANQYYSLTPQDPYIAVYDHGEPANSSFTTCS